MNLQLQSQVILVTGGAGGIGEAIVQTLAAERAIPCVLDRNEENGERLVQRLLSLRSEAYFFPLELSDPEACEYTVHQIVARIGRIDGIVNNAGVNDDIGLAKGDHHRFLQSLENNVGHYYSISRAALPALKRTGGNIVNIISKTAFTGQGNTSGYAAANGARSGLVTGLADELKPYQIRVNGIVVADTQAPLGKRCTSPREVANMTAFLLSSVSAAINRQTIFVDGGYVHLDRSIR
ncbi:SDR family NAD(P)-dependent oxidoreductase [Pseudobacter ginsenosidimutans]|uniref:L-fucose dehydrogenase n=1 Tax=Pseudobacter ginsenosidimutans TaxID=661488 RepID=A0A4Q7M9H3_9BACT|nr:SDR family NAD(P)-dependent oxidoreductase [Pseudobacter ginsenosidimutans]QEC42602.1 SDR family NAD(P)-dependent oxidoreductase [Pseudobacter ginsenosidimutans]RZS63907.1 L-fucose dehydrogenase [Pseudobacter ginsenosidimutans]